jgi:Skp family chaperone for outer membrane proteins
VAAAESQFNDKLRSVVVQFAKDEGFDLILEAASVAYASTGSDVTTAIIDLFDRMYPAAQTQKAP